MLVAKVIGSAVASVKLDALQSSKFLLVCPADSAGNPAGDPFIAIDLVGAGEGELVMLSQGSSARVACGNADRSPADAAIIGILDSLRSNGETVFRKA